MKTLVVLAGLAIASVASAADSPRVAIEGMIVLRECGEPVAIEVIAKKGDTQTVKFILKSEIDPKVFAGMVTDIEDVGKHGGPVMVIDLTGPCQTI